MAVTPHTVGLVVSDMARTLAFYRTLGLDIPDSEDHEAHVELETAGGVTLGFDTEAVVRAADVHWQEPNGSSRVNLQFQVTAPNTVDAVYERLVAVGAGAYQMPWDAPWGQRFARVTDPDGNVVSLFAGE